MKLNPVHVPEKAFANKWLNEASEVAGYIKDHHAKQLSAAGVQVLPLCRPECGCFFGFLGSSL